MRIGYNRQQQDPDMNEHIATPPIQNNATMEDASPSTPAACAEEEVHSAVEQQQKNDVAQKNEVSSDQSCAAVFKYAMNVFHEVAKEESGAWSLSAKNDPSNRIVAFYDPCGKLTVLRSNYMYKLTVTNQGEDSCVEFAQVDPMCLYERTVKPDFSAAWRKMAQNAINFFSERV